MGFLHKVLNWAVSAGIVVTAVVLGLVVLHRTNHHPRTDDAEVLANFIGIAPRPFQYALERAISEQAALEGQIEDERRRIAALVSAVSVSEANIKSSQADVDR